MSKDTRIFYTGETSPNDDIVGKIYIDESDSGDQLMIVWIIDALSPDRVVWVRPVSECSRRTWQRNAAILRPLIAAFEARTLAVSWAAQTLITERTSL